MAQEPNKNVRQLVKNKHTKRDVNGRGAPHDLSTPASYRCKAVVVKRRPSITRWLRGGDQLPIGAPCDSFLRFSLRHPWARVRPTNHRTKPVQQQQKSSRNNSLQNPVKRSRTEIEVHRRPARSLFFCEPDDSSRD